MVERISALFMRFNNLDTDGCRSVIGMSSVRVRVQRKIIICYKYQKVTFDIYRHFRWPADAFCYAMMADDVHEHERMYSLLHFVNDAIFSPIF